MGNGNFGDISKVLRSLVGRCLLDMFLADPVLQMDADNARLHDDYLYRSR